MLQVCDVVREALGLGSLPTEYLFEDGLEWEETAFASCEVFYTGWRVYITFYGRFFDCDLQKQLRIVVHEHLHAAMHPTSQAHHRTIDKLARKDRRAARTARITADEITVQHLEVPILNLLMPRIDRVL